MYQTKNAPEYSDLNSNSVFDDKQTGERWLVSSVHDKKRSLLIWVGLNDFERKMGVRVLIASLFIFLFLIFALAITLILRGVNYGFRPLKELARQVDGISMKRLEPITMNDVPSELVAAVKAINDLLCRLSSSLEKERVFLDFAAHEMRTPIAALKAQIQSYVASGEYHYSPKMKNIENAAHRIEMLSDQLLEWARVQSSNCMGANMVDVTEIVRQVVGDLIYQERIDIERVDIDIFPPEAFNVLANPSQIEIVVRNLIDNAVKYNDKQKARVRVSCYQLDSSFQIIIEDNGPGVDDAYLEDITKHFFRISPADQKGTGLGLSVVAEIIELNHGELQFGRSSGLSGLSVQVSLPMASRE
ncbi:sensor histidine kinase [Bacterioplanes sanyensis]|uniref:sensor histidine kinase n=1 Tax=Bacterioplanes sanyensis TaxID=1249553 RepID=UPI0012FDEA01|nr:HAMP domain-containing sensor histidine kinase [Bacterioplanes sanyensis]